MQRRKPSLKIIIVWEVYLCLLAAALYLAAGAMLPDAVAAIAQPALLFLTGGIALYIPLAVVCLSYSLTQDMLTIESGVILRSRRVVLPRAVRYLCAVRDPLQRLLGLEGLWILLAGNRLFLPGLTHDDAVRLQHEILYARGDRPAGGEARI